VGWTPAPAAAGTTAHRKVVATLQRLTDVAGNAPCVLCVRAALAVSGRSTIDGRPSGGSPCGGKGGAFTLGATGASTTSSVFGADGNDTANEATDLVQDQPASRFDAFTFTPADLDALRTLAKANATYYRGRVTFDGANRLENGVVFVDSASGDDIPLDQSRQDPSDFAEVDIRGAPFVDPTGFHGVLVVNGGLRIAGDMTMHGLVYAVSDVSYSGNAGGAVNGLVISQNVRDGAGSSVGGESTITFDCADARGAGYLPSGWFLRAGSYKEVND
jgi:hypothetical protein